jgi:hypothetical protein
MPVPGPGRKDQDEARVGRGAHLVALVRVEVSEESGAAGLDGTVVLDLHLAGGDHKVRPLVHLVLLQLFARGKVDRDDPRFVVRAQHLGVMRFYSQ